MTEYGNIVNRFNYTKEEGILRGRALRQAILANPEEAAQNFVKDLQTLEELRMSIRAGYFFGELSELLAVLPEQTRAVLIVAFIGAIEDSGTMAFRKFCSCVSDLANKERQKHGDMER